MKILSNRTYNRLIFKIKRLEEQIEQERTNHIIHIGEQQVRVNKMAKIFRDYVSQITGESK